MNNDQAVKTVLNDLRDKTAELLAKARTHTLSEATEICASVERQVQELQTKWDAIPEGLQAQYEERYRQQIHSQTNLLKDAMAFITEVENDDSKEEAG